MSDKQSEKPFAHDKQSATDVLRTASKKAIQKAVAATGDLIVNKIADKVKKASKNLTTE